MPGKESWAMEIDISAKVILIDILQRGLEDSPPLKI